MACVAGVAAALLTGCVSPAIDDAGYRGKVQHSAQAMAGIVAGARVAADLDLRGRLTEAVRDSVISDAENDAQSVLTAFEPVQPPDEAMVALRGGADPVLQRAAGDLSALRIALRAGERPQARAQLAALATDLAALHRLQDRT